MHIGSLILRELTSQQRSAAWFARQICCSRQHVYTIFKKKNIDVELLVRISRVLDHDFFADLSGDLSIGKGNVSNLPTLPSAIR